MTTLSDLFHKSGDDVFVDDVYKSYRAGGLVYEALRGVSLSIASGKVTIVQGPSGCGKSTLLNLISGVDTPDRGSLRFGIDEIARERSETDLSRHRLLRVGFVFQTFNLIPVLSAIDNLRVPMSFAGNPIGDQFERARRLLELVGVGDKGSKRPDELSGGEQQRVALALALTNDAPVILADEPTGNLDSENANMVTGLLRNLAHDFGKTVVITTHDPVVSGSGDVVIGLRDGQVEVKS